MSATQYVRNSRKKIHQNIHAPLPSRLAEPDKALIAGVTVTAVRGAANAETRIPDSAS